MRLVDSELSPQHDVYAAILSSLIFSRVKLIPILVTHMPSLFDVLREESSPRFQIWLIEVIYNYTLKMTQPCARS